MADNNSLHRLDLNHTGRPLHEWIHYIDIYERHFETYRGTKVTFREIGADQGGSQQMWRGYFEPDADLSSHTRYTKSLIDDPNFVRAKEQLRDDTEPAAKPRLTGPGGGGRTGLVCSIWRAARALADYASCLTRWRRSTLGWIRLPDCLMWTRPPA